METNGETPNQQFERLVRANINEARLKNSSLEQLAKEIIEATQWLAPKKADK